MLQYKQISALLLSVLMSSSIALGSIQMQQQQPPPQAPQQQMPPMQQQNQIDVSDEELQQFASAIQQVQVVSQTLQGEMIAEVEKAGFDVEKYNEIQQAFQTQTQEEVASEEELAQFEKATEKIMEIQTRGQKKMENAIVKSGMSIERYQQLSQAIQSSQSLQEKLQQYMQ